MPGLRAFAVSLAGSFHQADDLLQETLLKAWSSSDSFTPGTNMRAWLFTILRNTYYSLYRRRGREVQDTDGVYSGRIATPPNQEGALDIADFQAALAKLPPEHRDVLLDGRRIRIFLRGGGGNLRGRRRNGEEPAQSRPREARRGAWGSPKPPISVRTARSRRSSKTRTFRNEACERLRHEDGESAIARGDVADRHSRSRRHRSDRVLRLRGGGARRPRGPGDGRERARPGHALLARQRSGAPSPIRPRPPPSSAPAGARNSLRPSFVATPIMRRSASSTRPARPASPARPIDLSQLPADASVSKSSADFRLAVVDDRLWIATAGAAATSGPEPSGVLVLKADAVSSRLDPLDRSARPIWL